MFLGFGNSSKLKNISTQLFICTVCLGIVHISVHVAPDDRTVSLILCFMADLLIPCSNIISVSFFIKTYLGASLPS